LQNQKFWISIDRSKPNPSLGWRDQKRILRNEETIIGGKLDECVLSAILLV